MSLSRTQKWQNPVHYPNALILGLDLYWGDYNVPKGIWQEFILRNEEDGKFTDVSSDLGFAPKGRYVKDAVFFDYDNDGYIDLYIVSSTPKGSSTLYRNVDGTKLEDVTTQAGLPIEGLAVCTGDLDNDGYTDIILSSFSPKGVIIYRNNGDGTFTDVTANSGINEKNSFFSFLLGDMDGDGKLDIVGSYTNKMIIYHNEGDMRFKDVTKASGINVNVVGLIALGDYDNDGFLDIYVNRRYSGGYSLNILFENMGDGTFRDVSYTSGADSPRGDIGVTFGDFDSDGDLDIALLDRGLAISGESSVGRKTSFIYVNSGNRNSWLEVKLKGIKSNRMGIGAKIRVVAGGRSQLAEMGLAPAHFGLGKQSLIDTVEVRWPSGTIDRMFQVPANQLLTIEEGKTKPSVEVQELKAQRLPDSYMLFQNYPNPFNSETSIRYQIPQTGYVSLKVYNVLGQDVAALVNVWQKPGAYRVRLNSSKLSSGLYFYSLKAGDFVQAKRMMVLK